MIGLINKKLDLLKLQEFYIEVSLFSPIKIQKEYMTELKLKVQPDFD